MSQKVEIGQLKFSLKVGLKCVNNLFFIVSIRSLFKYHYYKITMNNRTGLHAYNCNM